ncbi:zinc finger domain-containing protein, partial [Neisseria gonorrhoeae]
KWTAIRKAREAVTAAIEPLRADKTVGSSLQAEAEITAPEEMAGYLNALGEELRFALLVSKAEVKTGDALAVAAKAGEGEKCERCWHYTHDVGAVAGYETVCKRCAENVGGEGETRHYA